MAEKGLGSLAGRADPTLVGVAMKASMMGGPPDLSEQHGDLAEVWGGFFEDTAKMNKALRDERDLLEKSLNDHFANWDELAAGMKNENEFEELNALITAQRQEFIDNNGFANDADGLNRWNRKNTQKLQALEIVDESINAYQTAIKSGEYSTVGQQNNELAFTNNIVAYHKNENGQAGGGNASFQENINSYFERNPKHVQIQTDNPDQYKILLKNLYNKEVKAGNIKDGQTIRYTDSNGDYAYVSNVTTGGTSEIMMRRAKDYKNHILLKDHESTANFIEQFNTNVTASATEGFLWNDTYAANQWTNIYSIMANSPDPQLAHQTLINSQTLPGANVGSAWVDRFANPDIKDFDEGVLKILNTVIKENGFGDMLEQIGNKNSTLEIEDIFKDDKISDDYKAFFSAITNPSDENYKKGGWKIGAGLFAQTQVNSFQTQSESVTVTGGDFETKFNQQAITLKNIQTEFEAYKIKNPDLGEGVVFDTGTQDTTYDWRADLGISFSLTGGEIDDLATNIEERNEITLGDETYTWDGTKYNSSAGEIKNLETLLATIDQGNQKLTNFSQFDNITDWDGEKEEVKEETKIKTTRVDTKELRKKFNKNSEKSVTAFLKELNKNYNIPSGVTIQQNTAGKWGLLYNKKFYESLQNWSAADASGLRGFLKAIGVDVGPTTLGG